MRFNDTVCSKRKCRTGLETIQFVENEHREKDQYIKLVMEAMITYKWYERYGLNFQETMQLEFSEFLLLDERIRTYSQQPNVTDILNQIQP